MAGQRKKFCAHGLQHLPNSVLSRIARDAPANAATLQPRLQPRPGHGAGSHLTCYTGNGVSDAAVFAGKAEPTDQN
jgi:hypothetical protein